MINAYQEFMKHTDGKTIKCATITRGDVDFDESVKTYLLPVGHTDEEFGQFLISLDFKYHEGYGEQELFGTIWYTDGTWSDRREYDGSEWWKHNSCPSIPNSLF